MTANERSELCLSVYSGIPWPKSENAIDFGPSVNQRFWAKVDSAEDGCWTWTACRSWKGYGLFGIRPAPGAPQSNKHAHRVAYEMLVGPIPVGLHIDHLCRNRACVRPDHMEPVTPRENWIRGNTPSAVHARQTHCIHGHPLFGDNLYVAPGNGMRACRTCKKARKRVYRQRAIEAASSTRQSA